MSGSFGFAIFVILCFMLIVCSVYILARVIFHAWFRAKRDHDGSTSSRREIPNGEAS